MLAERLNLRETSVYSWSQQARPQAAIGVMEASAAATDRATALRAGFAAALTSA